MRQIHFFQSCFRYLLLYFLVTIKYDGKENKKKADVGLIFILLGTFFSPVYECFHCSIYLFACLLLRSKMCLCGYIHCQCANKRWRMVIRCFSVRVQHVILCAVSPFLLTLEGTQNILLVYQIENSQGHATTKCLYRRIISLKPRKPIASKISPSSLPSSVRPIC